MHGEEGSWRKTGLSHLQIINSRSFAANNSPLPLMRALAGETYTWQIIPTRSPHLPLITRRPATASTCTAQSTVPSAPLRALPSAHLPATATAAAAAQAPAAPATTSATIASIAALTRPPFTPMAEPTIATRYGRTALPTHIHTCSLMYSPHLSAQA